MTDHEDCRGAAMTDHDADTETFKEMFPKTRTLLLAIGFPDEFDPNEVDPEDVADVLVEIINEKRRRNWPEIGRKNDVTVSAIPAAQWLTVRTVGDLRKRYSARTGDTPMTDHDAKVVAVRPDPFACWCEEPEGEPDEYVCGCGLVWVAYDHDPDILYAWGGYADE